PPHSEGRGDAGAGDPARARLGAHRDRRRAGQGSGRGQAQPAADVSESGGFGRRQRADRGARLARERGFGRFTTPSAIRRTNSALTRSIAASSLRYQLATAFAMPRMASTASRVSRSKRNSPRRTPSLSTSSYTRSSPRDHFPILRRLSAGPGPRAFTHTPTKSPRSGRGRGRGL